MVVGLIGATTSTTGLRVQAGLDKRPYPTGQKVPDADMAALAIDRADFHGEWNYTIAPRAQS